MRYLLDTHYILWTLFEPNKLSHKIKCILKDTESEKYVSSISLWEISLKYGLGKLELQGTNPEEIYQCILDSGFYLVDIHSALLATYYQLPKKEHHKDPFDRLLIWQAIHEKYTLITTDKKIHAYYATDGLEIIVP